MADFSSGIIRCDAAASAANIPIGTVATVHVVDLYPISGTLVIIARWR